MKRFVIAMLSIILAVMVMVGWGVPAKAYQPPIGMTGTSIDGNMIYLWAWDPQLLAWIGDQSDGTYANTNFSYDAAYYMIAWIGTKSGVQRVFMATYDPYRKKIQRGVMGPYDSVTNLTVQDGVISFIAMEGGARVFRFATYDPRLSIETFKSGSAVLDQNSLVANQHGVVGWTKYNPNSQTWGFLGAVYEPRAGQSPNLGNWILASTSPGGYGAISSLIINAAGTIVAATPGDVFLGYDPDLVQWYSGQTHGLAYFASNPSSGSPPLWVWITDLSIGALNWHYNFGDGNTSNNRSDYHVYQKTGEFVLAQTIATITEDKNFQRTISVKGGMGFLPLLLLDGS
jgi:hypothetical protein